MPLRNAMEYLMTEDRLVIAGRKIRSRLFVGTGKFPSSAALKACLDACDAEIVTVALRRADLSKPDDDSILSVVDRERHLLLPNTSGARNADEAVRLAKLARAAGLEPWVKLELTPEPRYLLPDPIETLKATELLVKEGFTVLPYIQADPILAKRLEEAGAATVMPLGAPSHAAASMEMGADAVLVNTALADARDHAAMAHAFALATEAGRAAYLAGLGPERSVAEASSPLTGFLRDTS